VKGEGKRPLGNVGINGRIILKMVLQEVEGGMD
jgi:hypothetical protein